MTPFIVATGNPDKAREIVAVFAEAIRVPLSTRDIACGSVRAVLVSESGAADVTVECTDEPDVDETGSTLEENARIKAQGWCVATGLPAIADDTGLFVDALQGAPGVYSARYAGEEATYADNVAKLLQELEGVSESDRGARFATVAVYMRPDGEELLASGTVLGHIIEAPRGTDGFGYDPVFVPLEGDGRTFAELSAAEKHAVSHRGRAFRSLATIMASIEADAATD